MQTLRGEYFIKKDFGFYDSGAIAVVGMVPLYVYELLRRYVWRSIESGDPEMRMLYRQGILAAKVSQSTIGELLGIKARQTICEYIGELKRLGWVRTVTLKNSSVKAYMLGEVVLDSYGRRHEVFFADAWMKDLWDAMTQIAEERGGPNALPTSLAVEERIELVRAFVAHTAVGEDTAEVTPGEGPGEGDVSLDDTPITHRRQGVSPTGDRGCHPQVTQEERVTPKGENDIEDRGLRLAAQGAPFVPEGGGRGQKKTPFNFPSSNPGAPKPPGQTTSASPKSSAAPPEEYNLPRPKTGGRYDDVDVSALIAQNREANVARMTQLADEAGTRASKLDNLKGRPAPVNTRKAVIDLDTHWRELMAKHFPDVVQPKMDPKGKEPKQIQGLLAKYDFEIVRDAMTYVAERWSQLRDRMFKGTGSPTPSIGLLLKLYDQLVPESQTYMKGAKTIEEAESILRADPYAELPGDLKDRYNRALKDLEALGVKK